MITLLYAYYDSRERIEGASPFYIGCGSKARIYTHLQKCYRNGKHWNPYMAEVLLAHEEAGTFPRIEILGSFKDSKEAKRQEKELIDHYGRRCDGSGVLCNMIRGGGGPRSEHMTTEIKRKISKSTKKMFEDETFRESFSKAIFDSWHNKETRERHLNGLKRANAKQSSEFRSKVQLKNYMENPERRIKISIAAKEINNRPGMKELKSRKSTEANHRTWADPEIRARRIAGMRNRKRKIVQNEQE